MNVQLTDTWKEGLARFIRRRPFNGLLAWGVRLTVPRQRVGVGLVTFNENEEILLLRHVFRTAYPWGLPGGWLGRNESPEEGLARELREETGRELIVGPPIQTTHERSPSHIVMAYLGWLQPGPMRLNSEIIEARWFDLGRLPQPLSSFSESAIAAGLSLNRLLADEPVAH